MIHQPTPLSKELKVLEITSEAFTDNSYIPIKYTCDGENINPPLLVKNIPEEAKSLVLIMVDPDASSGNWTHWLVWNIPPSGKIKENSSPGIEGMNDFKKQNYGGPCPSTGTHHYFFKVYALDDFIDLKPNATYKELEKAMSTHAIGFGKIMGLYKRASNFN